MYQLAVQDRTLQLAASRKTQNKIPPVGCGEVLKSCAVICSNFSAVSLLSSFPASEARRNGQLQLGSRRNIRSSLSYLAWTSKSNWALQIATNWGGRSTRWCWKTSWKAWSSAPVGTRSQLTRDCRLHQGMASNSMLKLGFVYALAPCKQEVQLIVLVSRVKFLQCSA